jgi:hypothetical protein
MNLRVQKVLVFNLKNSQKKLKIAKASWRWLAAQ